MWPYWVALATGPVILLATGLVFRMRRPPGLGGCFILGWGFQVILSLPAGIWQALTGWGFLSFHATALAWLPFMGWPFNAAGLSVRAFAVGLHSHWGSDPGMYFSAVMAQGFVVAVLFAWRYSERRTVQDPILIALAALFLANSLLNVQWEWLPPG
jgi:hypothetical protein